MHGGNVDCTSVINVGVTVVVTVRTRRNTALMRIIFDIAGCLCDIRKHGAVVGAAATGFRCARIHRTFLHHGACEPTFIASRKNAGMRRTGLYFFADIGTTGHIAAAVSTFSAVAVAHKLPLTTVAGIAIAIAPTKLTRSEEHTSELQSRGHLVCRL